MYTIKTISAFALLTLATTCAQPTTSIELVSESPIVTENVTSNSFSESSNATVVPSMNETTSSIESTTDSMSTQTTVDVSDATSTVDSMINATTSTDSMTTLTSTSEVTMTSTDSATVASEAANTNDTASAEPEVVADPCSCYLAVNGICVNTTLPITLAGAMYGDNITLSGDYLAVQPMNINQTLTLSGVMCNGTLPVITTYFKTFTPLIKETREQSMLRYTLFNISVPEVSVTLEDLKITRGEITADTYASALYSSGSMQLTVNNVEIANMRAFSHGGSAIYVATASGSVVLDEKTTIINNSVADGGCNEDDKRDPYCIAPNGGPDLHLCPDECFGGGGAVWVGSCFGTTAVNISAQFSNNNHEFGHGMGGAFFMDWVQCAVHINGAYTNNTSADGGAIHIESVQEGASMVFNGRYENNKALDGGWGARGAATRVRDIVGGSTVTILGDYVKNVCDGRGAVMAHNNINGTVYMNIVAEDNESTRGSATSVHGVVSDESKYTLAKECVFKGNEVEDDTLVDYNQYNEYDISEEDFNDDYHNKRDYVIEVEN